jgi:hypothetical protein
MMKIIVRIMNDMMTIMRNPKMRPCGKHRHLVRQDRLVDEKRAIQ